MRLHRLEHGVLLERDGTSLRLDDDWDALVNREDLAGYLRTADGRAAAAAARPLAPIGGQEVWAAGVTYFRSRAARMEESKTSGGGSFYDAVYSAARPELFFKAAPWRVRASGETVCIRSDARWSVPEPELALVINQRGGIVGYTIGNDMSSRDIEGENPLYLPQAKIYDGACALGPAMLVSEGPLPADTPITITIVRAGTAVFEGSTSLRQMRRTPEELVRYLYCETSFPHGAVLLTGTGVVPPDDFTLQAGDAISITIPPIGTLENLVGSRSAGSSQ
jgi:2-dehydro-3-deoxy-D-arabinonate dehydratase